MTEMHVVSCILVLGVAVYRLIRRLLRRWSLDYNAFIGGDRH